MTRVNDQQNLDVDDDGEYQERIENDASPNGEAGTTRRDRNQAQGCDDDDGPDGVELSGQRRVDQGDQPHGNTRRDTCCVAGDTSA